MRAFGLNLNVIGFQETMALNPYFHNRKHFQILSF